MEWVIIWLICAGGAAAIASAKGRNALGWFFGGFLLGPLGLLIVGFMPSVSAENAPDGAQGVSAGSSLYRACPYCAENILAAAKLCKHCKSAVEPLAVASENPSCSCPMCHDRGGATACPSCGRTAQPQSDSSTGQGQRYACSMCQDKGCGVMPCPACGRKSPDD